MERIYKITYLQGEAVVVHMDDCDIRFEKKNKMYVANFSDWVNPEELEKSREVLVFSTSGQTLMRNKERRAKAAMEFVRNATFLSEEEAVHMSRDGNFDAMPVDPKDVRVGFQEYGEHKNSCQK